MVAHFLELVSKDGKKLRSGPGLVEVESNHPLCAVRDTWPGFAATQNLLEPFTLASERISIGGDPFLVAELAPAAVHIDEERSECVRAAHGNRILRVRSAVILGDVLPPFMVVAQGPRYDFFFRGDIVESLQDLGALDAFEPTVVGHLNDG